MAEIIYRERPTVNQTIDKILFRIEPNQRYGFFLIWLDSYLGAYSPDKNYEHYRSTAVRCLDVMTQKGLVTKSYNDVNTLFIELTKKGNKIREDGGWLKYLESRKQVLETWIKRIAILESILIIISIPTGFYMQSKNNRLEQENILLKDSVGAYSQRIKYLESVAQKDTSNISVPDSTAH